MPKLVPDGIAVNGRLRALLISVPAAVILLTAATLLVASGRAEDVLEFFREYLPMFMFASLGVLLFSGYPVAFVLGGNALLFGFLGYLLGTFKLVEFFNFVPRIWGQAAENLVLVSVPTFVFMGVMMERSGIARDLLFCCQVLLRRVAGSLALSVTVMGTILAAMTGIIGASVTMMTSLALAPMLRQGYSHALATGCIAAAGTLGILIPPSIMLILFADLLSVSVGTLFMAALGPGLLLAALYLIGIGTACRLNPSLGPPLPPNELNMSGSEKAQLFLKSFLPPAILIGMIKGSILFGWATPSEAGAVGAFGAVALAFFKGRGGWSVLKEVANSASLTISMIFFIVIAATCFAYVFRALGGDHIAESMIRSAGLGTWGLTFLIMALVFLLGFFLDWIEITLIVLPVFGPMIARMDFGGWVPQEAVLIWFTVLLAVNLQTSFLTPPFGFALFYLKGLAPPEVKIQSIYRGIIPFVILQLICLGLVIAFPALSLWLPGVVYDN
ncbi:MAG TPA: TRAP transporter large permease subunit [Candidatus Binatia bacterium]|nr:TRAP transporter large permease subunit [Candidatus Binatia bacterium]